MIICATSCLPPLPQEVQTARTHPLCWNQRFPCSHTLWWRWRFTYLCHFLQSANPQASEKPQGHIRTLKLWVCTCSTPYCQECCLSMASNREVLCYRQRLQSCRATVKTDFDCHFLLNSLLKMFFLILNFFFQTDSSVSQNPFANSLVTVKPVDGHVPLWH